MKTVRILTALVFSFTFAFSQPLLKSIQAIDYNEYEFENYDYKKFMPVVIKVLSDNCDIKMDSILILIHHENYPNDVGYTVNENTELLFPRGQKYYLNIIRKGYATTRFQVITDGPINELVYSTTVNITTKKKGFLDQGFIAYDYKKKQVTHFVD